MFAQHFSGSSPIIADRNPTFGWTGSDEFCVQTAEAKPLTKLTFNLQANIFRDDPLLEEKSLKIIAACKVAC